MGLSQDFLAMLEARVTVEWFTGQDKWGNDTYSAPVEGVRAYVEPSSTSFGTDDGLGKQDGRTVTQQRLMTDALGIAPKDKVTLEDGRVLHVTDVETAKDEFGDDLYQMITGTTAQRG